LLPGMFTHSHTRAHARVAPARPEPSANTSPGSGRVPAMAVSPGCAAAAVSLPQRLRQRLAEQSGSGSAAARPSRAAGPGRGPLLSPRATFLPLACGDHPGSISPSQAWTTRHPPSLRTPRSRPRLPPLPSARPAAPRHPHAAFPGVTFFPVRLQGAQRQRFLPAPAVIWAASIPDTCTATPGTGGSRLQAGESLAGLFQQKQQKENKTINKAKKILKMLKQQIKNISELFPRTSPIFSIWKISTSWVQRSAFF